MRRKGRKGRREGKYTGGEEKDEVKKEGNRRIREGRKEVEKEARRKLRKEKITFDL